MLKTSFPGLAPGAKTIFAALAFASLAVTSASAQYESGMAGSEWMIDSQIRNDHWNKEMSRDYAWRYYNLLQGLRGQGYTGPSIPPGFIRPFVPYEPYHYHGRVYFHTP
jgi:hypothetical protein